MRRAQVTWNGIVLSALLLVFAVWSPHAAHSQDQEQEINGMIFGMPEAEVFEEDYDGAPVVGETATLHPQLAPLDYEGNKTHEIRVDVVAQEIEVAPGVRYEAWTFGGSVPGPVLHVREGDRIVFTMKNRSDEEVDVTEPLGMPLATSAAHGTAAGERTAAPGGSSPFTEQLAENNPQNAEAVAAPMPHSMDFHAGTVAKDDKWRTIAPGQTVQFEWVANYPGQYIYHCGTPPVLQHVAMGQYGLVVVSPKEGYPTDADVDREYTVTQSEFYLKEGSGENHVLDMDAAMDKDPSLVAFNGHRDALTETPLVAHPGERVRIHFLNAGPSQTSTFHVIGSILDRVYFEGHPQNEWFGLQSVLLGAGMGAVVEFIAPEEGEYTLVDHQFAEAARGATGKLVVVPEEEQ